MAKNANTGKEEGVEQKGESIPQEGKTPQEERPEEQKKEEEEKEKYVVQVSREVEGEDNWLNLKKEGKIFIFSSEKNAEESMNRVMQRHPEMVRGRVMRVQKNGDSSVLIPVIEVNGKQVIQKSRDILPKELQGYVDEEMLKMMNDEEISGIRSLIADLRRKKDELEKFSRIAVQRSGFLRDEKRVKEMQELKAKWERAKKRLENAKKEWEKTKEKVEDFINHSTGEFPELGNWLRVSITGEGQIIAPNRGQGRRRSPEGKKGIILRYLQEHRGQHLKESEIIKGIKEEGIGEGYSWTQQSTNPRLRAMLSEGLISQDESGRYYLP
ncbi:MAG: hypothetical protein ACXQTS_00585 [Candidatus Methanospirareceae archaeon]